MHTTIEREKSSVSDGMEVSIVHALPGRLRVHLSGWRGSEEQVERALAAAPGVRSVRASSLTGNVLISFDAARTDQHAVLAAVGRAAGGRPGPAVRADLGPRGGWKGGAARDRAPDPSRVVLPVLHLVYSCSPTGVGLHLAEIAWVLVRRRNRIHLGLPVLHLICGCSPVGAALHVGELAWALAPFLVL
ncbi:MAG: hypothetical protein JOZ41_21040 [Chloroflexi bacterium]|nr:hypothetical protein [Chloroflexota bacterium]